MSDFQERGYKDAGVGRVLATMPKDLDMDLDAFPEILLRHFYELTTAVLKTDSTFMGSVGEAINILYGQFMEYWREEEGRYCNYFEGVNLIQGDNDMMEPWIDHVEDEEVNDDSVKAGVRLFKCWVVSVLYECEEAFKPIGDELTFFALRAETPSWNPRSYFVFDSRESECVDPD